MEMAGRRALEGRKLQLWVGLEFQLSVTSVSGIVSGKLLKISEPCFLFWNLPE